MLKCVSNLLLSLGDPQLATTSKINPLIQDRVREQQEKDNRRQNRKNNKKESEKTAELIKNTISSFFAPPAYAAEYSDSSGTPVGDPQPNTTNSVNSPRVSNIRPNPVRQVATGPVTSPTTNPTAVGIQGSITPESAQRFAQVFGANDPVLTMGIGGLVR